VNNEIENIINNFNSVSLEEIDSVKLQKRVDTKFVFNRQKLPAILKEISQFYKVLEINGEKYQTYETDYYDTEVKKSYTDHHNGKLNRYKIRIRKYLNTKDEFFEIKYKNNKKVTIKKRFQIEGPVKDKMEIVTKGLENRKDIENKDVQLTLSNSFDRITLVNQIDKERITIDLNLSFNTLESSKSVDRIVICEIKTNRSSSKSYLSKVFKSHKIYPIRISKYVLGSMLLYPDIKKNRFKEKLLILKKTENEHVLT
jgi:VTC domain-containing protein